jgi:hypothetical protein
MKKTTIVTPDGHRYEQQQPLHHEPGSSHLSASLPAQLYLLSQTFSRW